MSCDSNRPLSRALIAWAIAGSRASSAPTIVLLTALLLLAIGVAAIASMQFDVGPFG